MLQFDPGASLNETTRAGDLTAARYGLQASAFRWLPLTGIGSICVHRVDAVGHGVSIIVDIEGNRQAAEQAERLSVFMGRSPFSVEPLVNRLTLGELSFHTRKL